MHSPQLEMIAPWMKHQLQSCHCAKLCLLLSSELIYSFFFTRVFVVLHIAVIEKSQYAMGLTLPFIDNPKISSLAQLEDARHFNILFLRWQFLWTSFSPLESYHHFQTHYLFHTFSGWEEYQVLAVMTSPLFRSDFPRRSVHSWV